RRRQHRCCAGGAGGARWLHPAGLVNAAARHQPEPLQAVVLQAGRIRADHKSRIGAQSRDGAQRAAGEFRQRADCTREGESWQARVWQPRGRQYSPPYRQYVHDMTGTSMVHVPYRGETLVYNDMLGERVDVFFGNMAGAFAFYLGGQLKVLAVADKARAAAMPDVPTSAEVGLPDLVSGVWYAMVGPPKLKPELRDQIAKATIEVLKMPDVQQRFRTLNVEPDGRSPAETDAFIKDEARRWGEVIRANNITAE